MSIECGLPPNTKVKIELDKQSNEFLIMKQTGDAEKYELKITNIALYIPVGQLSAAVYQHFNALQTRKIDPLPVVLHYRRIEVRSHFPKINKSIILMHCLRDLICHVVFYYALSKQKVKLVINKKIPIILK